MTFPRDSAFSLTKLLLGKKPGATKLLDEMDKSVLEEVGNIVAATFINTLSRITEKSLFTSVPKMAFKMAGAIIDYILIETSAVVEYAVVMEIIFHDIPETIRGKFFILPDPKSLELLLSAANIIAEKE